MAEPNTTGGIAIYLFFGALFASLEQGPAMGAVFGAFFFMAMKTPDITIWRKLLLLLFSWGLGYSAGIAVTSLGDTPGEYERLSMFCAIAFSALGSGAFSSWHTYQNGGPVPSWIVLLLDRLPFLKKRGDDNG